MQHVDRMVEVMKRVTAFCIELVRLLHHQGKLNLSYLELIEESSVVEHSGNKLYFLDFRVDCEYIEVPFI